MGMLEQAQADVRRIRNDVNGFTTEINFLAPTGETATIRGMAANIYMLSNPEFGEAVNERRAHISIVEAELNDLGYVTRNANNECSLKDHKVTLSDGTGVSKQWKIREVFPDSRLGITICMLGNLV